MEGKFDLGRYTKNISTSSCEAQRWFDLGLNWLYGFNQEESVECFKKAAKADPDCAIAYWGIAYASGPFYNMPWDMFSEHEETEMLNFCYANQQKALQLCHKASPLERALIQSLSKRFPSNQKDTLEHYAKRDDDYADAMRKAYNKFPEDLDVIALFAEAMMTRTPWKLWNLHTGEVAERADTLETIKVLDKGIKISQDRQMGPHPGILHLHIHVWEMSRHPERAMHSADRLHDIQPDGGHLHHMPAHIYALCGLYSDALAVSEKAIIADRKYLDYAGPYKFYTTACCHNLHMKMHAAMLSGLYQPAIEAANEITQLLSKEVLTVNKPYMATTLEGYYSMKVHVLVRFGLWQQIIDTPMLPDQELYCVTTAMHRYARGIAHAALGEFDEAEIEKKQFNDICKSIPANRIFFNNPALTILAVGGEMLNGELEYHKGNYQLAFDHLRKAVELNDNLAYTEPWAWMHPPRHALGALLMEQEHIEEAEQVYRADLGLDDSLIRSTQHPDNVWSLHGFYECLKSLGKQGEAKMVEQRLRLAMSRTDVEIRASCCCRGMQSPPCCH